MTGERTKRSNILGKYAFLALSLLCLLLPSCEADSSTAGAYYRRQGPARPAAKGRTVTRPIRGSVETPRRGRTRSTAASDHDSGEWDRYMAKFDIAHSHGAGIYVDLGGDATVSSKSYRMPTGKCPVMGKVLLLGNGADFLNPITTVDDRDRGLAFPETTAKDSKTQLARKNTRTRGRRQPSEEASISPVTAADLRGWGYDGDDVANCAEYASNIVSLADQNTKYRYPFVYDAKDEMCYVLYTPIQYNQGARYCDNDGKRDEGDSSMLCMKPIKSELDAKLYYGSAFVDRKWKEKCPMAPVRDAIFGKWSNGSCVAMTSAFQEYTDSMEECASIVFENSAADLDIDKKADNFNEVEALKQGLKSVDLTKVAEALFTPLVNAGTSAKKSGGVGMNWANYDSRTGLCRVLDSAPNCLVINAGSFALTALSSPLEKDAVNYPCNIKTNGYVEPRTRSYSRGDDEFEVTTSLSKDNLKCSMYVHKKKSASCGTYYYCSPFEADEPEEKSFDWKRIAKYAAAFLAAALLLLAFLWVFRCLWRTKQDDDDACDYDRLMSKYEYSETAHGPAGRREQQLTSDAYIWGEAVARPSDVTPVHISKAK
uniref:Apical membrane antigen 1 n=1 Tax=Babesia gibsoni TaxID=33632 RepID=D0QU01_BABGI|nr:apical membrane antigen 1 [Babesia gibsoni]